MNTYIIYIIAAFLLGIAVVKIIPLIKDRKVNKEEKEIIKKIVVDLLKTTIDLSKVENDKQLEDFCVDYVLLELEKQKIDYFTEDEVRIVVSLILKDIKNKIK